MKLIFSLLIILSLFSSAMTCDSHSSSSSSSSSPTSSTSESSSTSEECSPGYSGLNCSDFTHYSDSYSAAYPHGGSVLFFGNFGSTHDGLSIIVGSVTCSISVAFTTFIKCDLGVLESDTFYDVNITQNGVSWFKANYYRFQTNCVNGNTFSGYCECYSGFTGELCDVISPPYVETINPTSIDGGFIQAEGWFGLDPTPTSVSMYIGNNKVRISNINSNRLNGVAPQGTTAGFQDISFYNSNNTLISKTENVFQYDSTLCFNDCFGGGECINGKCQCYFPYTGDYCFNVIDSSAPACCSCECSQN